MDSIVVENLTVSYDKKIIIEGLDLKIPEEKITIIIGANGSGKSTLLKAIGRVIPAQQGTILLHQENITTLSRKDLAKKLAILPQAPRAPQGLTVHQLVSYGRFPHQGCFARNSKEDEEIIGWAIEATGLAEYEYTALNNLSGGQRQRAWIAMALVQKTDVILLDEPTTYLDLAYQLEVLELLYKLNRQEQRTIVMVLHDLNMAAKFADYIVGVSDGKIIQYGEPNTVITNEFLKEIFQIDAVIKKDEKTGKPVCVSYELLRNKT